MRLVLLTAAVAALATPVLAQDAARAAPSPTPVPVEGQAVSPAPVAEPESSPAEAALEAKGEAFEERMKAMGSEMEAAYTAAAGDQAKAEADLSVIADQYRHDAETFATEVRDFVISQTGAEGADGEAAQGAEQAYQVIRTIPDLIKQKVLAGESLDDSSDD